MHWGWMAASIGVSLLGMGAGSAGSAAAAKAQEKWQKYRNTMVQLSNANNQNAITVNTVREMQKSAREAMSIQEAGMAQTGASEVQAAAAGVQGRSVRATTMNLERGQLHAEETRKQNLQDLFVQETYSRRNSGFAASLQQDYSYIPQPSSVSSMLGLGANVLGKYGDQIGSWFSNLGGGSIGSGNGSVGNATQWNTPGGLTNIYGG